MAEEINEDLDNLIEKIEHEIREVSIYFELYLGLFGSQQNLKTINQSSPNVFLCFKQSLIDMCIIKLCRLFDPARQRNFENISLDLLIESLDDDREIQSRLREKKNEMDVHMVQIKPYRNKRLGHNDRITHEEDRLREISNRSIDTVINLLQEFVNIIRLNKYKYEVHIVNLDYPLGDGPDRLMRLLQKGIDANRSELDNA